ncbi:MAG TPA: methyl-accepting chemotaxis protein, partial [Nevskiaceae bacterium]|nr:methyl-accepting chemotaxis protein [Nevskiaceae bacterium]
MAEQETRRVGRTGRETALLFMTIVFFLVAIAAAAAYYTTTTRNQTWLDQSRQLPLDVAELAKVGEDATRGIAPDFQLLSGRSQDVGDNVRFLREGDAESGIKAMPSSVGQQVAAVEESWRAMKQAIDGVLAGEIPFRRTSTNIAAIAEAAPALITAYEQNADRLARSGAPAGQVFLAGSQVARLERIVASARNVTSQGRDAVASAAALDQEVKAFQKIGASADFETIATAAAAIVQDAEAVQKMQVSAATLQGAGTNVLATAKSLEQGLLDTVKVYTFAPMAAAFSAVIALLSLGLYIASTFRSVSDRQRAAEDRDARQQQAILGLLDEITNLADGDLTVDVTVTEDFTGAIADSINYTVGNMRNLVGTINSTSVELAGAATSTQDIALKMNEASERQAKEVAAVANTITATSQSLQQVAQRAEQLAQQARGSVDVAHAGAATVGRTIQGMAALREQIQDTSKRIKRLGESSQEIGNIIEFINDIAEQTNTLALNASIQAAMAGEAGRGFAVVADEVQRLAERAATATRQIENLVKTIQADTNEAIVSMERSTTNVVTGAKSAEEAGQALTKIETSSQELAKLITEISASARNQSAAATKIAGTMQVIR